jgi:hypothetical protein
MGVILHFAALRELQHLATVGVIMDIIIGIQPWIRIIIMWFNFTSLTTPAQTLGLK